MTNGPVNPRAWLVLALAATSSLICAVPAPAHESASAMSAAGLRAFEVETLGREHAREHALLRRVQRERPPLPDELALPSSASSTTLFGHRLDGSGLATQALPDCDSASSEPECAGQWAAPFQIPVMAINAVMLPTGKVLWWSYPRNPSATYGDPDAPNTAQAWLWNPTTGSTKRVDPPLWLDPADGQMKPANIWCSGQSLLIDGRVVVAGGNFSYPDDEGNDYRGLDTVFTFNPWNETWTRQPDMEHGRWYPSQLTLPDGRTVIMSGFDETGGGYASTNRQIEVFEASPDLDGVGTVEPIPGLRRESGPNNGYPPDGGLYPHMFVMPSGRALIAGPDPNDSWFLTDADPDADLSEQWEKAPGGEPSQRLWGSGVLMPPLPGVTEPSTRIGLFGGSDRSVSDVSTPESILYDEDDPGAGWHAGPAQNLGRGHLNTVLLPDGSMVSVGGGIGLGAPNDLWTATPQHKRVELYDPIAGSWRLGAAQAEYRAYHSTALLLPDGRVVSAGDDYNGGIDQDTAEIYSPPYLFRGPRPAIAAAPRSLGYGTAFEVDYSGPEVTRAVLIAPGATTHANDMNQRYVPLELTPGAPGKLSLKIPSGTAAGARFVAPPGAYMLFLVTADGVPSVARWVGVDTVLPEGPPPEQPPVVDPPVVDPPVVDPPVVDPPVVDPPVVDPPVPPAANRGPAIAFDRERGLNARKGLLGGRVHDPDGVRSVRVALGVRRDGRCRWWSARARKLASRQRPCAKPVLIKATLRRAGGVLRWTARLRGIPPAGRYLVRVTAVDRRGATSRIERRPVVVRAPR